MPNRASLFTTVPPNLPFLQAALAKALKKALRIKEISIENTADQRSSIVMISLKLYLIPLDLKVLIVGNDTIYQSLLAMDSDFRKLFKIKVEFEEDAPRNIDNMNKLARFVHGFCEQEELPHLDKGAMAKIVEYSSKLSGDMDKLSTIDTQNVLPGKTSLEMSAIGFNEVTWKIYVLQD